MRTENIIARADEGAEPDDKTKRAAEIDAAIKRADEEKAANEGKLDKLLTGLDAVMQACDSLSKRMDAYEAANPKETAADSARADAVAKPLTPTETQAIAEAWTAADSIMSALGERASHAMPGETLVSYRRRLLLPLQAHSPNWRGIDIATLPADALAIAETQIRADASAAARNPSSVPENTLRVVKTQDETGRTTTEFFGRPSVWLGPMGMSARRAMTRINTNSRYD